MDQPRGPGDVQSDLAAFLRTFETLPAHQKAEALQHIIRGQRGETPKSYGSATSSTHPANTSSNAHSCYICKQLVIIRKPNDTGFESEDVVFTKETLTQGHAQKCVLVEWIFMLLARGLHNLTSDLNKRNTLYRQQEAIRDVTNDLQCISATGVVLHCYGYGGDDDEVKIQLQYECEPFLVDGLWNVAHDLHSGKTYDMFERMYDGIVEASLRMTAAADDPAASDCRFRSATQRTGPEKILELARELLDNCQERHEECYRRATTLPSRLIDIGTRWPIHSVKLRWSEEEEIGKYAALSYCWGGLQPLTTTTTTAQDITNGLLFSDLPKTLQDAMKITMKLGLRYIWIDSLCILQDDPDDLTREIARMADTFQDAFVTISAASSSSVHSGFLSDRAVVPRTRIALPYQSSNVKSGTILLEEARRPYNPAEDPINLRAWTLQEHILSRRTLIFGTKELWWTCESASSFESLPTRHIEDVPVVQQKSSADRYTLKYWRSIVRDYTRRFLTCPNDKLSAIAGVANLYSQSFDSKYLAGLWKFSLLSELMWCSIRSDITRPVVQRAPSWSWASVDGEIHHNWCLVDPGPHAPEIIECRITPISQASPFGPVDPTRCVLRIRGTLIEAVWQEDRQYISTGRIDARTGEEIYCRMGRTHADAHDDSTPREVWVLPITTDPIRGLLLAHVEGGVFRRVGLVLRLWDDAFMPADDELQTISII